MTADLSALEIERRLTSIEATLPTFATKADIHSLKVDMQVMRSEWKADLGELKTDIQAMQSEWKTGIQAMRSEWKSDIQAMQSEWKTDIQAMRSEWKTDLGEINTDLHAREARLIKWIAGLVVAAAAAAAGVAIAVNQAFGPVAGG